MIRIKFVLKVIYLCLFSGFQIPVEFGCFNTVNTTRIIGDE